MNDERTIRVEFERWNALGKASGTGEIYGTTDYVLGTLREHIDTLRELHPGDRLLLTVECDVPAGHPLAGINLQA